MIVLFAADGNTLDSRIARRFGKATWFLVVDTKTFSISATPNRVPLDYHDVIRKAADKGASVLICGDIGPRSFDLATAHSMTVYRAEGLTCNEALHVLQAGSLRKLDGPTLRHNLGVREPYSMHATKGRRPGGYARRWHGYPAGSLRGKHRVQQYSGRGH